MKETEQNQVFERQPWHLNVSEIASWAGVHRDTLHDRGVLSDPVARVGRESLHDVREVLKKFHVEQITADDDGDLIDGNREKLLLIRAQRIGQEIKNAQAMGELAPLDLMTSALGDALQSANSWLESVPAQIKRVWPEADGAVLEVVERECARVRNTIADARINYTDPRMAPLSDGPDEVGAANGREH